MVGCVRKIGTSVLTTFLTIYRIGLLGNSAHKRPRKHRFRTKKHTKVVKKRYFTAMELFGTSMPQVQVLSLRPKIRRAEHNRLIKSIVLSLYIVVLWLFSQPFFFSIFREVAKIVAKIIINEIMTHFFADFQQKPNALCLRTVLKKRKTHGTVEHLICTP